MVATFSACVAGGDAGSCEDVWSSGGVWSGGGASPHGRAWPGGGASPPGVDRFCVCDGRRHGEHASDVVSHEPNCGGEHGGLAQSAETEAAPAAHRWAAASTARERPLRLAAEPATGPPQAAAWTVVDPVRPAAQPQPYWGSQGQRPPTSVWL